jgi:hypothetical protein
MRLAQSLVVGLLLGAGVAGCAKTDPGATIAKPAKPVVFQDVTAEAGIDFTHVNGAAGRKLMPETVGSGLAFFDFDNDNDQDLLIVDSSTWPGAPKQAGGRPRLYRNAGDGKFTDVSREVGLDFRIYGMGVAVGDFDNDGDPDVYLTAVGPNKLLRNDNGRFVDITPTAGVQGVPLAGLKLEDKWSSGAAWVDIDNDGDLDLFVCQYVRWSPALDPFCGKNGVRGYCPPGTFEGARNTLYRNDGNGRFANVSKAYGLFDCAVGKSFGISLFDANNDGFVDLAVSNDTWANFLLINENGKYLRDKGVESGIAYAENGRAKAGMGIDVADYRNNGTWGMVIGNFAEEGLSLFDPMDGMDGMYENQAQNRGLVSPSLLSVTFATFFFDYDLDGWQDLLATNGHVDDIVNTYKSNLTFKQLPHLFRNENGTKFREATAETGLDFRIVGRGAAYGDIDNDGDLDIGIVDNGGKFRLLRNDGGNQNRWIRIRLQGTRANRDAIGSVVSVRAGGTTQRQIVRSGGSFLSESQRELTFGLGTAEKADAIEVRWPDGTTEKLAGTEAGRLIRITQGKGLETP